MKKILLCLIISATLLAPFISSAQQYKISGHVFDDQSNAPLVSANIVIQETQKGAISGEDGYFELQLSDNKPVTLAITYIGYQTIELVAQPDGKNLRIFMKSISIMGEEVVVSASRIGEQIRKAPATIHKINAKEIQASTSGDYFQDLANVRDVEIINNSMGFKIFNARGFNTTAPLRVVQYIDGVDNQLPTINIVPGNMFGTSDLDIAGVEVISGPASAMYGPNAMQGVLSYTTKDPYAYKGVSAKVKGGNREFIEAQFRYADAFFKNKLGFKIVGSYLNALDWQANNPSANLYGHQPSPPLNIDGIINQLAQADPENIFSEFQDYAEAYPDANPGMTQFFMPGYMETDLYNGYTNNYKVAASLHYRFGRNLEAKYLYRYSTGTSVYMGNNRAPLQNFYQQIHSLELKGKQFVVRAFRSNDDTRNTYAFNATGPLMGFAALPQAGGLYSAGYVESMYSLSEGFTSPYNDNFGVVSNQQGMNASDNAWLQPGTEAFNQAFEQIKGTTPPKGSNFSSKATIYNIDGVYNFELEKLDINLGANYRNMHPVSHGTVYEDTLQQDGTYKEIYVSEYGGFAQAILKLLGDDLKIYGSVRLDKSQNFDLQFSPRLGLVYSYKANTFRLTAQSAFRMPALTDQYQYLNRGRDIVIGNINGVGNVYTNSSVNGFLPPFGDMDPSKLQTTYVNAVKPEQLQSLEIGYNTIVKNKVFIDLSAYYSRYTDFIGYVAVVQPNSGVAGEASGVEALVSGDFQRYSVATNSSTDIDTYGGGIGVNYYFWKNTRAYINYTYANIDSTGIQDQIIPGFNTPKHKVNIGVAGEKVIENFGFGVNWKWADNYYWQSIFASGPVNAYSVLDIQINYAIPSWYSIIRIGGSNVLDQKYYQAYGMPEIGGFYYISWTFNLDFK